MDRKRALVVIVGAIAAVVLGASPAFAHDALVTGTVSCTPAGDQLVTWYNQQGPPGWGPATISASNRASVAVGQSVPGTTPVQVGTETFVPAASGPRTLVVSWHWADGANDTSSGTVTLGIDCTHPTPPPTTPPPTTPAADVPSAHLTATDESSSDLEFVDQHAAALVEQQFDASERHQLLDDDRSAQRDVGIDRPGHCVHRDVVSAADRAGRVPDPGDRRARHQPPEGGRGLRPDRDVDLRGARRSHATRPREPKSAVVPTGFEPVSPP